MLTFVIFSYNRAMQLNTLLCSIQQYCKFQIKVYVLYNCREHFAGGYDLLKQRYPEVIFRKESPTSGTLSRYSFPWTLANWKHFAKYPWLRKAKTNFRHCLMDILSETSDQLVAFLTDDSVFIEDFSLPEQFRNEISASPEQLSFSLRLGKNISLLESYQPCGDNMIAWRYDDPANQKDWRYFFSVDGHIYAGSLLQKMCQRVLFSNPSSFEAFAFDYFRRRKNLLKGMAFCHSKLLSYPVNMVQTVQNNKTQSLSLEILEKYFLQGWQLEYPLAHRTHTFQNYPPCVILSQPGKAPVRLSTTESTMQ